jgi:isopenicillin N synthase-like dioxygenase
MPIRFLSLFSVHFTLPQTQNSAALLRILHYPPQPPHVESSEHAHGIGAHTEYVAGLI